MLDERERATRLAAQLRQAGADLIGVIESVSDRQWRHVLAAGTWSICKDAEHVAEAAIYHQWIVRLTIDEGVSSHRPVLERSRMTSDLSQADAADLIRSRIEEGVSLLLSLTDAQLALPTRPPRARGQRLAETIERVLIGHLDQHRLAIEVKLRDLA